MSVVIHEFEVDAQPSAPDVSEGASSPSFEPPKLSAQDIERMLCREKERAFRVWAH